MSDLPADALTEATESDVPSAGSAARRFGLDLFWAYAAAGAKVLSWVIVTALVFRRLGAFEFAMLALARATVGLLTYAGVGLTPALIHRMSKASAEAAPPVRLRGSRPEPPSDKPAPVLSYAASGTRVAEQRWTTHVPYTNGLVIVGFGACVGLIALWIYYTFFIRIHRIDAAPVLAESVRNMVFYLGMGTLLRLISDVPGAVLQSTGWIWVDYAILTLGEVTWVAMVYFDLSGNLDPNSIANVGYTYIWSAVAVFALRWLFGGLRQNLLLPDPKLINRDELIALLSFGVSVLLSQVAEFLYYPTALILIQQLLGPDDVAHYTPAVQIDSGLLLIISGLGMVILPRAAGAHSRADTPALSRYYFRGTAASFMMLLVVASLVWAVSPALFRLWLGNDMPATRAILPLVLVSTVIGGSAAVGRSILLGMGRVKAYTASALTAGVMNVLLSYAFVRHLGLGLKGIVLGTTVVVVARCAIWMPWYVFLSVTRFQKRKDLHH
jgi:O-antigen/teichoic acid export membrane protein